MWNAAKIAKVKGQPFPPFDRSDFRGRGGRPDVIYTFEKPVIISQAHTHARSQASPKISQSPRSSCQIRNSKSHRYHIPPSYTGVPIPSLPPLPHRGAIAIIASTALTVVEV